MLAIPTTGIGSAHRLLFGGDPVLLAQFIGAPLPPRHSLGVSSRLKKRASLGDFALHSCLPAQQGAPASLPQWWVLYRRRVDVRLGLGDACERGEDVACRNVG